MQTVKGSNIKDIRQHNRLLVLKHIAAKPMVSRMELSEITGLSKMAVGNMVNDLMDLKLVEEIKLSPDTNAYGRPPGALRLSNSSPLICGMLIKRGLFQTVLADLSGDIVDREEIRYDQGLRKEDIATWLVGAYRRLRARQHRDVIAVGISAIGPVDTKRGIILNPPFFHGLSNVEIVREVQSEIGLPTYLINDANAGALAEKLYGQGQAEKNFCYLHIMNGIGVGCVLDSKLYSGDFGQSGEIGHTTINCMGPKCECGNVGCLELYANVDNMKSRIRELEEMLHVRFPLRQGEKLGWMSILGQANRGNQLAVLALEEFCTHISFAMTNIVNLLDLSHIIVGYDSDVTGDVLERLLQEKLQKRALYTGYRRIEVRRSVFEGDAPLVGAIACCAEKIFDLELKILPEG